MSPVERARKIIQKMPWFAMCLHVWFPRYLHLKIGKTADSHTGEKIFIFTIPICEGLFVTPICEGDIPPPTQKKQLNFYPKW